jgi:putative transposase
VDRQSGPVFQARSRAIVFDQSSYWLEPVGYLHLDSVRAGLVSRAEAWLWSSHRSYWGLADTAWLYQTDVRACIGRGVPSEPIAR